ncbi:hypothetical protein [Dechloromonas denitrificans]|uniref:hypothetical protein n=1 Tax=Dechloromonas denitrificans TaxID=281362 RepID=UPI001CF86A77|nr:hypothetical protein [Dechloromonas denitrificans]UCV02299.1 hypothetical protein KI611_14530 [Dechloromonas denitrificans]
MPQLNALALRLIVGAALLLALVIGSYYYGRHVLAGEVAADKLAEALAYAGEIVKAQDTADKLAEENTQLRTAQAPKDRIIAQEITRYVQVTPPAQRCTLPGTWRLRHDAAATGQPAPTEAGPVVDGSADPVADAAALETVGDNYAACRESIAKLEGWQRRQRAIEAKP